MLNRNCLTGQMNMTEQLWAVIPAAGLGVRAGCSKPKQFVTIGGRTLLEWTATKVLSLPEVKGAVIALPPGFNSHEQVRRKIASLVRARPKNIITVTGAATRQESVRLALEEVPPEVAWVMVHDAARPLLSHDLARRVIEAARRYSAAICGLHITDTVKSVLQSEQQGLWLAKGTLSRQGVIAVQTPQVFRLGLLKHCHEVARQDGFTGTDDSQLVERLGREVAIVQGESVNLKVTFPEDFEMVELVLAPLYRASELNNVSGSRLCQARSPRRTRKRYPLTGFGFDIHPLVHGRKCIIGGVEIPFEKGLLGHSDADVLCHAVADAVLGALNMGDIGKWFPPGDPRFQDARSVDLLREIRAIAWRTLEIVHLDCTLVAQAPRLAPYMECMKDNISEVFSIPRDRVSIKATSPEMLGSLGKQEGIAAFCAATVVKKGRVSL